MKKARDLLKSISGGGSRTSRSFLIQNPNVTSASKMEMDPSERYCFNPELRWNPKLEEYFVSAYGADHFARISKALTNPSCYSCIRVNTLKTTSDAVIEKLKIIINDSEQGANLSVTDGSNSISKCQIPGLDYVVFVKGSGPHSIDYGYAPEKPPKEVLVSRKCAEAVLRGAQAYVPGVIACSAHVEQGEEVAVSVAIEQPTDNGGWAVGMTRGTVLQGLSTDPYYYERKGLYIGQGTAKLSRAGMFRVLKGIAVDMTNRVFRLPSFYNVLEGDIFLQNLPSIVTAHALDPQRGERILDMCAAPGGKTTAIAILMKDDGEIVAADRSHNKVLDIQNLCVEMGLSCVSTCKLDALKACQRNKLNDTKNVHDGEADVGLAVHSPELSPVQPDGKMLSQNSRKLEDVTASGENVSNEKHNEKTHVSKADIRKNMERMKNGTGRNQSQGGRVEKSKGFPPNSFDRVLLDAPCSALGLRPRLFSGEDTVESLRNDAKYQRKMFDQAVQLVRPGGVLVYSTCTINPGENEALVRYALDTYKFLSLAPQHPRIGGPGLVGSFEFPDGYVEEWLRPGEEELVQRFDPSGPLDTIGFFIAKFSIGTKD